MRVHKKYQRALDEFVQRILAARRDPGNPASPVDSYAFGQVLSVLETAVDFQPDVPEGERRRLVSKAAFGVVRRAPSEGIVGGETLVDELKSAERDYLQQPLRDLVLAGSLRIRPFAALRRARVLDSVVRFRAHLPNGFDRGPLAARLRAQFPRGYREDLVALFPVRARTEHAAVEQGTYRLDLLRAYWNVALNARTLERGGWGTPQPVNQVLSGPLLTVHAPDGSLAGRNFWYYAQDASANRPFDLAAQWDEARRFRRVMARWERRVSYAEWMRDTLVGYVRALDVVPHDVAYHRLWTVLERLLSAERGGYDQVLARLQFLYAPADQPFVEALLEHLRDIRNGLVHEARGRSRMEAYLYQLKGCVERVIGYYVRDGHRFASFREAAHFLDHPPDTAEMQRTVAGLRRAIRLRDRAEALDA